MNRFWNELEDFYTRLDERRAKENNNFALPEYTTDAFDHNRETAENDLNARIEAEADIVIMDKLEKSSVVLNNSKNISPSIGDKQQQRLRLQSYDVHINSDFDEYDDDEDEDSDVWRSEDDEEQQRVHRLPLPPATSPIMLKNIVSFFAHKF